MIRAKRVAAMGTTLVVAGLVGGCGQSTSAPGEPFPVRPADLPIAGLPACDTLDDRQAADLMIRSRDADVLERGENSCSFGASGGRGWDIQIYPGISARSYVPGTPGYRGDEIGVRDSRVFTVAGYGAVELEYGPGEYTSNCSVVVDAAPDDSFLVTYSGGPPGSGSDPGDRPQRCAQASRVAEMVITTARSRG